MSDLVTERRLVDVLTHYLRKTHRGVAREVIHYEKRIDLAAVNPQSDELWAIEAKTKNWNEAVAQAIVNLAVAHRSYVAIYAENAHRVPSDILDEYGLGLISVGTSWEDVKVLREATPSPYQNRLTANRMIAELTNSGP